MSKEKIAMFRRGKIHRQELELPTMHFVVMDQWVDVIGEKALFAWLRMYTWCKRDEDTGKNQWEESRIPTSYNQIIKKLGVGRDTFYNKVLKPLWDVGLIDVEEFKESENKGVKPMNIIVYKYPQNDITLAHQEIKKVRDYNQDYSSQSRTFARKGGRPSNDSVESSPQEGGSEIESGSVLNENGGGFPNGMGGGSKVEPNNSLNSINNSLNNINNIFNSSSNDFNVESDFHKKTDELVDESLLSIKEKDTTTTTHLIDEDVRDIIRFWDDNGFGVHAIHPKKQLLEYLDDNDFITPKDMILKALKIACENNKQSFAYVKTILHDWIRKGVHDLQALDKHEEKRTRSKDPTKQEMNNDNITSYGSIPKGEMNEEEKAYWDEQNQLLLDSLPDFMKR